jgi:hypothetical protein
VVDGLHQHRDAEHVGEQDELLPRAVALVAGGGEKRDRLRPLALGELDILDERVQVPNQRPQDLPAAITLPVRSVGGWRADDVVTIA